MATKPLTLDRTVIVIAGHGAVAAWIGLLAGAAFGVVTVGPVNLSIALAIGGVCVGGYRERDAWLFAMRNRDKVRQ